MNHNILVAGKRTWLLTVYWFFWERLFIGFYWLKMFILKNFWYTWNGHSRDQKEINFQTEVWTQPQKKDGFWIYMGCGAVGSLLEIPALGYQTGSRGTENLMYTWSNHELPGPCLHRLEHQIRWNTCITNKKHKQYEMLFANWNSSPQRTNREQCKSSTGYCKVYSTNNIVIGFLKSYSPLHSPRSRGHVSRSRRSRTLLVFLNVDAKFNP
jgi:hypothetical protein